MTTPMTIPQALEHAVRLHKSGNLREAEAIYRQILAGHPDQPDAQHLLGVMALNGGQPQVAIDLINRAIAVQPAVADYHANLALALTKVDRLAQAIAAAQKAVALRPQSAQWQFNLASLFRRANRLDEAITAYRAALSLQPGLAEAWNNLGNALAAKGQPEEAMSAYRKAIAIRPDYVEAHNNLAALLTGQGRLDEAISVVRHAIALRGDAQGYYNLANALTFKGQFADAIDSYRQALALRPDYAEAWNHLSIALRRHGKLEEGAAAARKAIDLNPQFFAARNNLANALKELGRFQEAAATYRQAIAIQPESPHAHFNLGATLLLLGDIETGWAEYEWRWRAPDYYRSTRAGERPRWDGSPLAGRRILLLAEQGFGDVIQFVRYAPLVVERGGTVIVECQPELKRLLTRAPGVGQIVTLRDRLTDYDLHCPLMSLPLALRVTVQTIPATVPYLSADPALAEQWQARLAGTNELKVGLVWAGNPGHINDRTRSLPLSAFAALSQVPAVRFFSLQKGAAGKQAADPPANLNLTDWTSDIDDFADTAALITNLDLVIAADTAVAHLAGAMGKPTWVLLPTVPDFRWLLGRSDSPWYPTMRLFRQESYGNWAPTIARIVQALREKCV